MCSKSGYGMRACVCEKLAVRACKKKRGKLGSSVRVEKGRKALCEEKRRRWVGDGHGN
jgi:hypothetical protein